MRAISSSMQGFVMVEELLDVGNGVRNNLEGPEDSYDEDEDEDSDAM